MRFTVVWLRESLDELAQIWIESSDRESVTDATGAIDAELSQDPAPKGSHVSEGLHRVVRGPLDVMYCIREEDRVVEVLRVRLA